MGRSTMTNYRWVKMEQFFSISLIISFVLYTGWKIYKQPYWEREAIEKITNFEKCLDSSIDNYQMYTNDHGVFWQKSDYSQIKKYIMGSTELGAYFTASKSKFTFKIDEKNKVVLFALGSNTFDWERLKLP